MQLSDQLVSEISKKLVEDEVEKAKEQLVPIIQKQLNQYIKSTGFLKKVKAQVIVDLENELEEGDRLFEYLDSKDQKKMWAKIVKSVFKF